MNFLFVIGWMLSGGAQAGEYEQAVKPLVGKYCVVCHSAAKRAGELNLERFGSYEDVMKDPRPWQKAVEQITLGEMPPKGMPQMTVGERSKLLEWTRGALRAAAAARAGDPGPVVLRRLNNAEYTYTIRELTGVGTLDVAREFPADGAAGEGFMNTGNALAMSPALVGKYLEAGKAVAAHAVLAPTGIRFSAATSRRDWTDELLGEIRKFYAAHTEHGGVDNVVQQGVALDKNRGGTLPLKAYLTASLELRGSAGSVEAVARKHKLSGKYLGMVVGMMKGVRGGPLAEGLRKQWRAGDVEGMVGEIKAWQEALWKFNSVGHIGKADGPKSWMEAVSPVVEEQAFRVKLAGSAGEKALTVYLTAHEAGDGANGDAVVWRAPRIAMAGREAVLVRDLPALVEAIGMERKRVFGETARALEGSGEGKSWREFLAIGGGRAPAVELLQKKIEKSGGFEFVQGWGSAQTPMVLANASETRTVRVPGTMKPRSVAVHPAVKQAVAVGWVSPVDGVARLEGTLQRVHAECGNGIAWWMELRRGGARVRLGEGELRNAAALGLGPVEGMRVQRGDLVTVVVGPREGNHSCDLTSVEMKVGVGEKVWSLSGDVAGSVLAGNPHGGVWEFFSEGLEERGVVIAGGSLLGKWVLAADGAERRRLAEGLERLLTGAAPAVGDGSVDAVLYRQLASLGGPLFAGVKAEGGRGAGGEWGVDAALLAANGDVLMKAPGVVEVRLPAELVAGGELVVTGALAESASGEGSVQLEVGVGKRVTPSARLLPAGTVIGDAKGTWTSNNQTVAYGLPVVVKGKSAAAARVEREFAEFRALFPASLCYTKIVPVDEVVTLTLFHREDEPLGRLILNEREKARLDRLWEELRYVSRDALTLVDVFEQLWQYATQDADPSKFEPLRGPILARAAAFQELMKRTEPRHVEAVVEFAGRAYRRPLADGERRQLRELYGQLRGQEMGHEEAIRLMLARVLVAPAFLYKSETARPGKAATPVGDYELATRLSYFLWSSPPDGTLLAAAGAGKLRSAAGIQAEARRMMKDEERMRRMAKEFGAAWLHIHGFDELDEKSERHFPTFRGLRGEMYEESIRFFTDLFVKDRPVLAVVDSDYAFLNEALAGHYGIPGVKGTEWRRVEGVKQYGRGGVLGQATVLSKQAGASRTSPILRGNWISEVLLGDKLPRPPKDVPPLAADEMEEMLTVRQLTERHSKDARCAGCHARVDAFGYALERYDAIGRRRDVDVKQRPIDDRAVLRDGTPLDGVEGLKAYLLGKGKAGFVRQFSKKLLGYALGRAVELSDEPLLEAIEARLAAKGYHVGTAIDAIVASRQFREIRGRDHGAEEVE